MFLMCFECGAERNRVTSPGLCPRSVLQLQEMKPVTVSPQRRHMGGSLKSNAMTQRIRKGRGGKMRWTQTESWKEVISSSYTPRPVSEFSCAGLKTKSGPKKFWKQGDVASLWPWKLEPPAPWLWVRDFIGRSDAVWGTSCESGCFAAQNEKAQEVLQDLFARLCSKGENETLKSECFHKT